MRRNFHTAVAGSGLFPAIAALRLAERVGPERVLLATGDTMPGGNCPALLVHDLVRPETLEFLHDFMVLEWDRFAVIDEGEIRVHEGRLGLVDPVQVHAGFATAASGMTVLTGVASTRALDGYLIVDGDIHACEAALPFPPGFASGTQDCIVESRLAGELGCPILLQVVDGGASQIIPIAEGRCFLNRLPGEPVRDAAGRIDLGRTFPFHAAVDGLLA